MDSTSNPDMVRHALGHKSGVLDTTRVRALLNARDDLNKRIHTLQENGPLWVTRDLIANYRGQLARIDARLANVRGIVPAHPDTEPGTDTDDSAS